MKVSAQCASTTQANLWSIRRNTRCRQSGRGRCRERSLESLACMESAKHRCLFLPGRNQLILDDRHAGSLVDGDGQSLLHQLFTIHFELLAPVELGDLILRFRFQLREVSSEPTRKGCWPAETPARCRRFARADRTARRSKRYYLS